MALLSNGCRFAIAPNASSLFRLQVVLCEGCRHASHREHAFDFIANLAGSSQLRLAAVDTLCTELAQQVQVRLNQLSQASKICAQSADSGEQAVMHSMDRIRAALQQRQDQLISELKQTREVLLNIAIWLMYGPKSSCATVWTDAHRDIITASVHAQMLWCAHLMLSTEPSWCA